MIGLIGGNHLDKTKPTGLFGVGVTHDLAFLDIAVLLEEEGNLILGQRWGNTRDEKVRARVNTVIIVFGVVTILGATIKA